MPTEQLFKGLSFRDSRDYKGDSFQNYLTPNTYQPLRDVSGFGRWDDMIDENRLIAINQPTAMGLGNYNQSQVNNARVSPIPEPIKTTFIQGTEIQVFYWLGDNQIGNSFTIIPFKDVEIDQLSDEDSRTLLQKLLIWVSENISGVLAERLQESADEETGNKPRLQRLITFMKRYSFGSALGVWVTGARVSEPIDVVTGTFENGLPLSGRGKTDGVQSSKTVNPLPYIVSGLGVVTGSPTIIASGLLLRFLESRGQK